MINQVMLIGRVEKEYEKVNSKEGKLTIKIRRNYKDINGEYPNDFVEVIFYNFNEMLKECCLYNSVIGVKGRLETDKKGKLRVIAEKTTFLSNNEQNESK